MTHDLNPESEKIEAGHPAAPGVPSEGARNSAEEPNFERAVSRFMKDEDGQSMVEFVVIMPIFLFLIFGIIQFMLIANVSYLLNYGNFMAMRTVVARWEMSVIGTPNDAANGHVQKNIPPTAKIEAENALRYSLLPVAYLRGDRLVSMYFLSQTARVRMNLDATNNWIESYSEYEYPLYIPLAKNIIYAIAQGEEGEGPTTQTILPYAAEDDPLFGIDFARIFSMHTLDMKTNSEIPATGEQPKEGGNPHKMLIHRRW